MNVPVNINLETNSASGHYNFKHAQFHRLYNALSYIDWSFLFRDVNEACQTFYNKLYSLLAMYVPKCKNSQYKFPDRYTNQIIINTTISL